MDMIGMATTTTVCMVKRSVYMAESVSDVFGSVRYPDMEAPEDGNCGDTVMLVGMKIYNWVLGKWCKPNHFQKKH